MRRTPLKRHAGLRARPSTRRGAVRNTGPDAKTRQVVCAREDWRCAACGISVIGRPYSIQHRIARGMGGTSRPGANTLPNLILLCGSATTPGSCHQACEQRDPDMHGRGYWLWSWEDPAEVPVMLASFHDSGMTVWLTDSGGYSTEPPGGAEAA